MTNFAQGRTRPITLTLPVSLIAEAESAVAAGNARSVSAYIAEHAFRPTGTRSLLEVLDALDAADPRAYTDAEVAEVEQRTAELMSRLAAGDLHSHQAAA